MRGDSFTQGRYSLRSERGTSCCLGVWADLKHLQRVQKGGDWQYTFPSGRASFTTLDDDWFAQFFDYTPEDATPYLSKSDAVARLIGTLMELNDAKDKTFPEIADWIEENLSATPPATPQTEGEPS